MKTHEDMSADLTVIPDWVRARSEIVGDCLLWRGRMSYRTPLMRLPGGSKDHAVHRFVFEVAYGVELARSQQVRRTCDNPRCVRPAHLRAPRVLTGPRGGEQHAEDPA